MATSATEPAAAPAPDRPTSPDAEVGAGPALGLAAGDRLGRFVRRHGLLIATGATIGLVLGIVVAILVPATYESQVAVLLTRIPTDTGVDPAAGDLTAVQEALASEARFVNSVAVRDAVRDSLPGAPARIDVEVDAEQRILRLTASGSSADAAVRLARNWANAYISTRRSALIDTVAEHNAFLDKRLNDLVIEIGEARLAGDDATVDRLSVERDQLAAESTAGANDLNVLQSGSGAQVVEDAELPTGRSGVALLPATVLGLLGGAGIGAAVGRWRDQRARAETEAQDWLAANPVDDASFDATFDFGDRPPVPTPVPKPAARPSGAAPAAAAARSPAPATVADESPPRTRSGPTDRLMPGLDIPSFLDPPAVDPGPVPAAATVSPARSRSAGRITIPTDETSPRSLRVVDAARNSTGGPEPASTTDPWADDLSLITDSYPT